MVTQDVIVAPPPGPASTPYQVMDPKPNYSQRYSSQGGGITGAIQLICGILVVILGIVAHAMELSWSFVSTGIWSGLMFFTIAGILGIVSSRRQTGVIVGYMVMSILAAIVSFCAGCTYAYLSWAIQTYICPVVSILDEGLAGLDSFDALDDVPRGIINCENRTADIAVNSCLAICFFVEFIAAIVGSGFTCAGVCCTSQPTVSTTHTTMTVVEPQSHVPITKPGEIQIQPGVAVTPPAYYAM